MRREDKMISDPEVVESILLKADICHVAMIDDGEPYLVPLNFGYKDRTLYFHSAATGRKIEVMKKNPRVCFEVALPHTIITGEVACDWTTKYRSVIGYGTVSFSDDPEEKKAGLDTIMAKYGQMENTYRSGSLRNMIIGMIVVEEMSGKQSHDWEE